MGKTAVFKLLKVLSWGSWVNQGFRWFGFTTYVEWSPYFIWSRYLSFSRWSLKIKHLPSSAGNFRALICSLRKQNKKESDLTAGSPAFVWSGSAGSPAESPAPWVDNVFHTSCVCSTASRRGPSCSRMSLRRTTSICTALSPYNRTCSVSIRVLFKFSVLCGSPVFIRAMSMFPPYWTT